MWVVDTVCAHEACHQVEAVKLDPELVLRPLAALSGERVSEEIGLAICEPKLELQVVDGQGIG
ncbi:hypothetical protein D3C86_2130330 [compost metagenome]